MNITAASPGICPLSTVLRLAYRDMRTVSLGQLNQETRSLLVDCTNVSTAAVRLLIEINRPHYANQLYRVLPVQT
ncbi:hypothetical protein Erwinia_phage_Pastis_00103 [Erwinia phage Pastis]|nr:hypothetical protein Erwinia_phage_Pastis_00103 [Erwinia phage Pastis]